MFARLFRVRERILKLSSNDPGKFQIFVVGFMLFVFGTIAFKVFSGRQNVEEIKKYFSTLSHKQIKHVVWVSGYELDSDLTQKITSPKVLEDIVKALQDTTTWSMPNRAQGATYSFAIHDKAGKITSFQCHFMQKGGNVARLSFRSVFGPISSSAGNLRSTRFGLWLRKQLKRPTKKTKR